MLTPYAASGAAQIGCALQPTDPCHSFLQTLAYVQLFIGAVIASCTQASRLAIIRPYRTTYCYPPYPTVLPIVDRKPAH